MADINKSGRDRNDFRKGSVVRKIHEDPTYLSFFFMFDDQDRMHSPLLSGAAEDYLSKVLNQDYAKQYLTNLKNFKKVLFKINKEMPWFWQSITGLDLAMTYNGMQEPFWGAEKPKLEITCLEENVELTAFGLMDLYKRACYDFTRWVEVIPHNLRHFSMTVFVTEIRAFQQDTAARNLGIYDEDGALFNASNAGGTSVIPINQEFSVEAKPFIQLKFEHCEFDIDSIASMFSDLSKNPELIKPKIAIRWDSVSQVNQKLGTNLELEAIDSPFDGITGEAASYNPFDPSNDRRTVNGNDGFSLPSDATFKETLKKRTLGRVTDAVNDTVDAVGNRVENIQNSLTLQNNSDIGNVYGQPTGLAGQLLNRAEDAVLGKLLLGNVHGLNPGTLLDAIGQGSVNGILNQVGQLFGVNDPLQTPNMDNVHPTAVDSSPDGNISPKKVYDDIPQEPQVRINENVYPNPGIDSTPDGNLNQNVHE